MGYLDNTTTTVDAILTKKGRELLARGENEFNITKFALSDDEIDYTLWDVTHPDGTNSYGAVIENMPVLEAFPDENQVMRYKLVSLPKDTAKLPIIEVPQSSILFKNAGVVQPITPTTRNGSDAKLGYSIILHNSDAADLVVAQGGEVVSTGATTPVFLSDTERKKSITVVGSSFNLISRSTSSTIVTQATIHGNETGATITIPVTVNANS
jgi:hypothetical protein|tara:strand:+ start:3704 stop:4336 length:633 start_codon:yes stop_codon:yes gene_type:complete